MKKREKIDKITPLEIREYIRSLPPIQRDKVSENYKGLNVNWKVNFKDAIPLGKDNLYLITHYNEGYTWVVVGIEIDKNKYPRINTIKEDHIMMVKGKINSIDNPFRSIDIKDPTIDFDPKELFSKDQDKSKEKESHDQFTLKTPFQKKQKGWVENWWAKYLVWPFIVGLVLIVVGIFVNKLNKDRVGNKTDLQTMHTTPFPANLFLSKSILRPLEPLETNKDISMLPNGIYGYAYNFRVAGFIQNKSKQLTLTSQVDNYKFEIQKNHDNISIVGFIDEITFSKIGSVSEKSPLQIEIFPINWKGDKKLILVPIDSFINITDRDIDIDQHARMGILEGAVTTIISNNDVEIYRKILD